MAGAWPEHAEQNTWIRMKEAFLWVYVFPPVEVSVGIEFDCWQTCAFCIDHRKAKKTRAGAAPLMAATKLSPPKGASDDYLVDLIMRGLLSATSRCGVEDTIIRRRTQTEYLSFAPYARGLEPFTLHIHEKLPNMPNMETARPLTRRALSASMFDRPKLRATASRASSALPPR